MLKHCLATTLMMLSSFVYSQSSDTQSPAEQVYKNVSNSIYILYGETETGKKQVLGSGVAIGEHLLATNCHVALSRNILRVMVNNESLLGRLIYNDLDNDLCIIEIPEAHFNSVKIRPSNKTTIGEEVFAIGNPRGYEKTISNGILSNKVIENHKPEIVTTAPISPGSSGGGLFDRNSNLIGITTSSSRGTGDENLNFAVPSELIIDYLNSNQKAIAEQSTQETTAEKTSPQNESTTTSSSTKSTNTSSSDVSIMGYYGKSGVGLIKSGSNCLISIIGRRYEPNKTPDNTSLVLYSPELPKALFIIPSTADINTAMKYFNKFIADKDPKVHSAHSVLVLDKKLNDINYDANLDLPYSVMIAMMKDDISDRLMVDDDFFIQFYQFRDIPGMTTIQFDLDGFTEALHAYNKNCEQ